MAEVDRARFLAGLDSVPCRLTLGVVPGGPSLPQPDLTGASLGTDVLLLGQESVHGYGVKKVGRLIRNRTAV